jgi:antitoxin FitA
MPANLTLKNVPDTLYELLKTAAVTHRRSLNSEAIVCLESVLIPTKVTPNERLTRARALRANLFKDKVFTPEDIDFFKREGRP